MGLTIADDSGMLIQSRERLLPTEVMIMGEYFGFYGEMDAYEDRIDMDMDIDIEDTMLEDEEDYDDEEEWEDYDNEDIYDHNEYTDW